MSSDPVLSNQDKKGSGWQEIWPPIRDITSLFLTVIIVVSAIFVPGPQTTALVGLVPVILGLLALSRAKG